MRMPHWPTAPWQKKYKHDLSRVLSIMEGLGNPHLKLPPVIHIAGTNGKGSSVSLLKSIFQKADYKVHTYTSPHLLEFNERIVLQGEKISDDFLFEVLERTRLACEKLNIQPSFFEGATAAAFLAFASIEADVLILETGLGGRLDATNIVSSPLITLITPISLDHMEVLGENLKAIAGEKAGIIKENSPCVISKQEEEVYELLLGKCYEKSSPSFCYEYDFIVEKSTNGFFYKSKANKYEFSSPALLGDHQLINAGSAISIISLINQQYQINNQIINEGLIAASWPARIEKVPYYKYKNLTNSNINIWLDGAHNIGGAQALSKWIAENLKNEPVYLIIGMTKNRSIEEFTSCFKGLFTKGFCVKVMSEGSSYSADEIAKRAGENFEAKDSLGEAILDINNISQGIPAHIVICCSLFLIADFYNLIHN